MYFHCMDIEIFAVVAYVLAILFMSGGALSRKIILLTLGNGLVLYGRKKERDDPLRRMTWHSRAGFLVLLFSLSYNWWYDSIAVAGNILGLLAMDGHRTLLATYHALASLNAHGIVLFARILMTIAYAN